MCVCAVMNVCVCVLVSCSFEFTGTARTVEALLSAFKTDTFTLPV